MHGLRMLVTAAAVAGGCGALAAEPGDLFAPIYAVTQHPRCTNCHAVGDMPLQRDSRPHVPPVVRGPDGKGTAQLPCRKCHTDRNTASAPGAPNWRMPAPPRTLVFRGRSAGALCRQMIDPARNGGKDAEALGRHFLEDPLVGWAWNPGAGRSVPPLPRDELVRAVAVWLRSGAPCPED